MSDLPRIVIGIPGKWADRSEIVQSIVSQSGGYLFAGMVLMHIETKTPFSLEVYEQSANLRRAFEVAGGGRISQADIAAIAEHSYTLYVGSDGGSFERARSIMQAANALLDSGGIAVKIESSGVAHSAGRWQELTNYETPWSLLQAYVTYVGEDGSYYSCGMHSMGLRDAIVTADIAQDDAVRLLQAFVKYLVLEEPTLHDGETFSIAEHEPRYRLQKSSCTLYPDGPNDLFHNPYGMWQLTPA